jgi:hypothetical protein
MNAPEARSAPEAAKQLESLAEDLEARGFTAQVVRNGGYAHISVVAPAMAPLSQAVYAAPADDGTWWFWWPWADPITPVSDVEIAAVEITCRLTKSANN